MPGIAGVDQPAEKRYAMRLWIDAEKLRAYGLSPLDVRAAVNRENVELPSGRIEGDAVELAGEDHVAARTRRRSSTRSSSSAAAIASCASATSAAPSSARRTSAARSRWAITPIAGLYFKPQPGANQIEIVDELRRRLAQIQREVPDDIKVDVAYDNTEYVRRSLLEVTRDDLHRVRCWSCWSCSRSCANGARR